MMSPTHTCTCSNRWAESQLFLQLGSWCSYMFSAQASSSFMSSSSSSSFFLARKRDNTTRLSTTLWLYAVVQCIYFRYLYTHSSSGQYKSSSWHVNIIQKNKIKTNIIKYLKSQQNYVTQIYTPSQAIILATNKYLSEQVLSMFWKFKSCLPYFRKEEALQGRCHQRPSPRLLHNVHLWQWHNQWQPLPMISGNRET